MDVNFPVFATGYVFSGLVTMESKRIQNRPPTKLTIGLGNRLSGVYMQNSTNTTVNQGHNS
jgi:hypothetical protein